MNQLSPAFELPLTRAIEHGEQSTDVEIRVRREEGTERVILTGATPIRDAQGRVIEAVAVFQDVTERKQAEEERERLLDEIQVERTHLDVVVNNTPSAIIYVDAVTGYVRANSAASHLFGHPFVVEDGQSQYLWQLRHPDGQPLTLQELPSQRALRGKATLHEELLVVRPNGESVPVLDCAAAVRTSDGHVVGAVVEFQERLRIEGNRATTGGVDLDHCPRSASADQYHHRLCPPVGDGRIRVNRAAP